MPRGRPHKPEPPPGSDAAKARKSPRKKPDRPDKPGPRPGMENPNRLIEGNFGSVFTWERADRIIAGVGDGLFDTQNALRNGIHPDTIKSWVDRGLAEDAE